MTKDTTFLVTLYIPNGNNSTKQLAYIAKTEAFMALRENLQTRHHANYHDEFATAVEKEVNLLKDHKRGIAVFARFTPSRKPTDDDITVQVLSHEPEQSHYVGDTFNISELLRTREMAKQALVVNVHRDKADIFLLQNDEFIPTVSVENQFALNKEPAVYHEQYNIGAGGQQIHQGSGTKTLEKRIDQENLRFLNDVQTVIEQLSPIDRTSLQYVIVLYSNQFQIHMERFTDAVCKHFGGITCTLISKTLSEYRDIEKVAKDTLVDMVQQRKEELLQEAQENYHLYTEDYESVQQASLESRVDTLFVSPHIIDPLLIHQVMQTGGDIVFVDNPEIAAKLRY